MPLVITKSRIEGVIVVHLSGAILFGEDSKSLFIAVRDLLREPSRIVLDLRDVTRIDSSGLGMLVALHVSARKLGSAIKFANLGSHAREVLHITKLGTVFEIFGSTEDAVASFRGASANG